MTTTKTLLQVTDPWKTEPLMVGTRDEVADWLSARRIPIDKIQRLVMVAEHGNTTERDNNAFMLNLGTMCWVSIA